MTPRKRRSIVRDIDSLRFAAGWRHVVGDELHLGPVAVDPFPDDAITVDLVRPWDLVALTCTFVECDLSAGAELTPLVKPRKDKRALLVVQHSFQHAFEQAIYEKQPKVYVSDNGDAKEEAAALQAPAGARPQPPVGFRPARGSRVVFEMAEDIEFSTVGILTAMTRLPLALTDLATPGGEAPTTGTNASPWSLHLGGNLVAEFAEGGILVRNARRTELRDAPDPTSVAGALQLNRNLARLRTEMRRTTPVLAPRTEMAADSIFAPGRGLVVDRPPIRRRPKPRFSAPPDALQTAIEAPYRLVISPTEEARWAHGVEPEPAADADLHIELWHSRLAGKPLADGQEPDESDTSRRVVRAIWARDRDWVEDTWHTWTGKESDDSYPLQHPVYDASADPHVIRRPGLDPAVVDPNFRGSLDRFDRHMLVRQSSETWVNGTDSLDPVPVGADALWLSSLGAWLDLHGAWSTKQYSAWPGMFQSILSWDHVAPLGRDQYVRVMYPGYLFPFGHQATLVKVTERKIKDQDPQFASLYQRMFIVIGERSRDYPTAYDLPFDRVDIRPLVTPVLDPPVGNQQSTFFVPHVDTQPFVFTLDTLDRDSQPKRLHTPLLWVNEAFHEADQIIAAWGEGKISGDGQNVAFVAKLADKPDSRLETTAFWIKGEPGLGESTPRMSAAAVRLPAVQRLSPTGDIPVSYRPEYVTAKGDLADGNVGNVWATVRESGDPADGPVASGLQMEFGASGAGSDKAGGFLSPSLPIRALSAASGPVGDIQSAVTNKLDPIAFLAGAMPKLFGMIDLFSILEIDNLVPEVVTDTLGQVEQFAKDAERLLAQVELAATEAQQLVNRAQGKSQELQAQANAAKAQVADAQTKADALLQKATALIANVTNPGFDFGAAANDLVSAADDAVDAVDELAAKLPPLARDELRRLIGIVKGYVADVAGLVETLQAAAEFLDAKQLSFRFEWRPKLRPWPPGAPVFTPDPATKVDHLVISVHGRVNAQGDAEVATRAELRDFSLTLFGDKPLMKVPFDHMYFKAGSSGKPEVDVVLGDIQFLGLLGFVETIKDLIPFDGFSDPPYMEVTAEGAKAGFTLALPSIAIGAFNLSNMSLGADVNVPFLGKSVTVGFNFCTRERPFTLTVMCLGGGGWFLIRVAPTGLDILEAGLEATASLALDFGVASGSISASVGVYIRLEGEEGSLTGYFRLRGEVDVLGLISASIELYMELMYNFSTGKMIGRATITVEVDVLVFSGSVKISAERQLAGANGDPSLREVLGAETGTSAYWNDYCAAFAAEGA